MKSSLHHYSHLGLICKLVLVEGCPLFSIPSSRNQILVPVDLNFSHGFLVDMDLKTIWYFEKVISVTVDPDAWYLAVTVV